MKIISNANETVLEILKTFRKESSDNRMMKYCAHMPVEEGVLLFNLLTRELLLLTEEEYNHATELDYLKKQWFVVPQNANEKEYTDFVKLVMKSRQKKNKEITFYTVFPTTDCNARCFYCFEHGCSHRNMSVETAQKVVQYIKAHCGGKKVRFLWFGGEPLYHQEAIDTICNGLRAEGVEFTSNMLSNGYLFDDVAVKKAVECWNLKRVQLSFDGTEEVYNKIKAYIYREGNPYQIVLKNIDRLLAASVSVVVRLNMDLYNIEDLLSLVDELAERFSEREKLCIYARHLFRADLPNAELHSVEGWEARDEAMRALEERIASHGLSSKLRISREFKMNSCIADNDSAVTILPDGHIGACEHFTENEFVGHIDREGFDAEMVASWKEAIPESPECADCFYYPSCILLKKCTNQSVCYPRYRQDRLKRTQRQMTGEYAMWQTQSDEEADEVITQDD